MELPIISLISHLQQRPSVGASEGARNLIMDIYTISCPEEKILLNPKQSMVGLYSEVSKYIYLMNLHFSYLVVDRLIELLHLYY